MLAGISGTPGGTQGDQRPMAPGLLRLLRHGTSARALLSRRGLSSLGANCAMREGSKLVVKLPTESGDLTCHHQRIVILNMSNKKVEKMIIVDKMINYDFKIVVFQK
jgi:hypothetical protein